MMKNSLQHGLKKESKEGRKKGRRGGWKYFSWDWMKHGEFCVWIALVVTQIYSCDNTA